MVKSARAPEERREEVEKAEGQNNGEGIKKDLPSGGASGGRGEGTALILNYP